MKRAIEVREGARDAVFVVLLGSLLVAAESARVVDQFAIVGVVIPFGPKGIPEGDIHLRGETLQNAAHPDVEEVHQVGIGDGVVVRWIGADEVVLSTADANCALCRHARHCRRFDSA